MPIAVLLFGAAPYSWTLQEQGVAQGVEGWLEKLEDLLEGPALRGKEARPAGRYDLPG